MTRTDGDLVPFLPVSEQKQDHRGKGEEANQEGGRRSVLYTASWMDNLIGVFNERLLLLLILLGNNLRSIVRFHDFCV